MSTLILSYPGSDFLPRGSTEQPGGVARRALEQWLNLCDHIVRAGGRILVIDPPSSAESTTSQALANPVYAAHIGAPFLTPTTGQGPLFLRARGSSEDPPAERDPVCIALRHAGLAVQVAQHRWQGQAELIALPSNRFLLTRGPQSDPESLEEIKRLLPMGAHVLCIEISATTGLSCLVHLLAKGGASILLVQRSALLSHTPEDISRFVLGGSTEILILSEEDSAAHTTESLCVRGTIHMPLGVSTILRGQLMRRGFQIVQVDVSALFGSEGGGPRALANEWPGFVLSDDSPSYATRRSELFALLANYSS